EGDLAELEGPRVEVGIELVGDGDRPGRGRGGRGVLEVDRVAQRRAGGDGMDVARAARGDLVVWGGRAADARGRGPERVGDGTGQVGEADRGPEALAVDAGAGEDIAERGPEVGRPPPDAPVRAVEARHGERDRAGDAADDDRLDQPGQAPVAVDRR